MIRVLVRHKPDREHLLLYHIDPDTGREVSKSSGTADKREAERAAAIWQAEINDRRGPDGTKWEWFRQRFESEHLATLPSKTRRSYATALNHFRRLVKVELISDVTAGTISVFQAALIREKRPNTSISNYLTHIRTALRWADRVGMCEAPAIVLPKTGKRKFMRGRPLTEQEYHAMLAKCEAPDYRRFLEMLWLSGLRLGEGMLLSWDSPPIYVLLDAKPYPQLVFYEEGHKARQDDVIPLVPDFAAWLSQTPPELRTGLVAPLTGIRHRQRAESTVSRTITETGKAAGITVNQHGKFASAHDLRRSFGTRWAMKVKPMTLQKLMRHASIETTLRYYVGLSSEDAGADVWKS